MKNPRFPPLFLFLLLLWPGILLAADYSGSYRSADEGGMLTLSLAQDARGTVTGAMYGEGVEYTLIGRLQGGSLAGTLSGDGERLGFLARYEGGQLVLGLGDPDIPPEAGEAAEVLIFLPMPSPVGSHAASPDPKPAEAAAMDRPADVVINGIPLSAQQVEGLEQAYGIRPLPGDYWYDTVSGLYGVVGFQAFGFMLPGHDFGALDAGASNGDTGVFVNGRQLPQPEWLVWSRLLGYPIQPGRYWLDTNGNAGYEGNPIPTENLYLAARRNAYPGGGGDAWSSRFSAGGYDSGGERGYVSVPGHGPVGYGF